MHLDYCAAPHSVSQDSWCSCCSFDIVIPALNPGNKISKADPHSVASACYLCKLHVEHLSQFYRVSQRTEKLVKKHFCACYSNTSRVHNDPIPRLWYS